MNFILWQYLSSQSHFWQDDKINADSEVDDDRHYSIYTKFESDHKTAENLEELKQDINYPSPAIANRTWGPKGSIPTVSCRKSNE